MMGLFHKNKKPDPPEPSGEGCIVSDRITKDGYKVGYMYRERPSAKRPDSGWRFLAGNEDDAYMRDASHHHVYALSSVCQYDGDIAAYLKAEIGSTFIRISDSAFERDDGTKPIFLAKQDKRS